MSIVLNGTSGITSEAIDLTTPLSAEDGGVPVGTIIDFASSTPPSGYLACNGASLSTTTYARLFAVIGYAYGGAGASFSLPNFTTGLAAVQGTPSGTKTAGQMPAHTHLQNGTNVNSGGNSTPSTGSGASSSGSTTASTGSGTDNLAAGVYVQKCIKF